MEAAMRDSDFLKYNGAQDFYGLVEEKKGRWRVWSLDGEPATRFLEDLYHAQKRLWALCVRIGLSWMKKECLDRIIRRELKQSPRPDWRRVCDEWARYRGDPNYDSRCLESASGERSATVGNNIILFPGLA